MASMRDIKRRKESITSTSQITKAMKLVSTVKLQKAKGHAEETKPYFNKMYEIVSKMLANVNETTNPMFCAKEGDGPKNKAVIMITSNRGLAGGYNSNIVKLITNGDFDPDHTIIYPIGSKGKDTMSRRGWKCQGDYSEIINKPMFSDAVQIGKAVMSDLQQGQIDEVYLAYTIFKNSVTQIPTLLKVLPFEKEDLPVEEEKSQDSGMLMTYEPGEEEALEYIVPLYMNSLIFGAMVESVASENGARMQAMDNATSNAEDMIGNLELQYNRARQAAITQELTEIVAGASAIS
ncbi:MAG: ATP synthase F1 subunit gamma [Eubacterium sp.]|nr:ATP synthase F1 subunit gamma [Eubacterium sp.]